MDEINSEIKYLNFISTDVSRSKLNLVFTFYENNINHKDRDKYVPYYKYSHYVERAFASDGSWITSLVGRKLTPPKNCGSETSDAYLTKLVLQFFNAVESLVRTPKIEIEIASMQGYPIWLEHAVEKFFNQLDVNKRIDVGEWTSFPTTGHKMKIIKDDLIVCEAILWEMDKATSLYALELIHPDENIRRANAYCIPMDSLAEVNKFCR